MEAGQLRYAYEAEERADESLAIRATRRTLDVGVAVLVLLVASPLLALIAIAVRIESRGPAIFRQRRVGRDEQVFVVHKFRTMRQDADEAPHREYVQQLIGGTAEKHKSQNGELFKLAVDDRVTRTGRLLRNTSLDEIPQLWNVIRGEMSLVGPRPIVPYELEHYSSWYRERFAVKPGLTGLWQVSGRNERTYAEMVELDVEYVRRRTVRLDCTILFKTIWVVLTRRGAA